MLYTLWRINRMWKSIIIRQFNQKWNTTQQIFILIVIHQWFIIRAFLFVFLFYQEVSLFLFCFDIERTLQAVQLCKAVWQKLYKLNAPVERHTFTKHSHVSFSYTQTHTFIKESIYSTQTRRDTHTPHFLWLILETNLCAVMLVKYMKSL